MNATEADIEYIDDEWINEYKNEEKKYDIFYKKEVSSIKLFFIYIAKENEIEKIIKENYNIINKSISKKELTKIIKEHATKEDATKEYILNSIFKYNITLKPDEIEDFINNVNENNYMTNIILQQHADDDADDDDDDADDDDADDDEFEDILFENTIDFFKDLNAIYIIYTLHAEEVSLPEEAGLSEEPALVRKKLNKTKKNTHNSIKNNKTSKNQKNLKII